MVTAKCKRQATSIIEGSENLAAEVKMSERAM